MTELLTAQEYARLLKISTRQFWRLRDSGGVPTPIRVGNGRTLRWLRAHAEEHILAGMPNIRTSDWRPMTGLNTEKRKKQ